MSSANIVLCSQRLLVNIFKTPVLRKQYGILSCNMNVSNYFGHSRFISKAVYQESCIEKDFKAKSELNNDVNSITKSKTLKKDAQLPDGHDPDVFGTLDKGFKLERKLEEMPEEEDDVKEITFYDEKNMRRGTLTINKYGKIIKYFLDKKKLGNALDVLETRMLKEDKVTPDRYIYNLLISGCAKYGYTKKAFQLFNQMKKRGIDPSPSTYTSLFNACSVSPWTHDGVKRLKRLRELILEKGYTPNQKNYHAMIKAYGRCKDLESAFNIVDEMLEKRVKITNETFNFLLQSCITDSEAGLRHAILVWKKLLTKGLRPDLYSFNLMLRCTRDCGLGNIEATYDVIQTVIGSSNEDNHLLKSGKTDMSCSNPPSENGDVNLIELRERKTVDSLQVSDELVENRPNLLSRYPRLGDIVGLSDIKLPEHRLILLGGCEGFLREMKLNRIQPDIKTFTQLLEVIPSTLSAEQSLLNDLSELKVQPDIDFFNILIKKRSMRYDYKNAREVLKLIQKHLLSPDIVTFGVLSLSCLTVEDANQLIQDMNDLGYRMNIQILGALLRNATVSWDIYYIIKVMKLLLDENVTPSPTFMQYLAQFYASVTKYKRMVEHKKKSDLKEEDKKFVDMVNDENFMKQFENYCNVYKWWRKKALPEEPVHPYAQFQKHNDPEDAAVMNTGRSSI